MEGIQELVAYYPPCDQENELPHHTLTFLEIREQPMADPTLPRHPVISADDHPEPLVVRPRVAWRLLDCGNAYGYRLIAAGELETYRDGRARKITVDSIRRYVERRLAKRGMS